MHTVSVSTTIPHAPSEAWRDLTEGARLGRWFADSGDLRPGGAFRLDFGDGDCFLGGVTHWEPERALGLEWRFMGLGPAFQIRFELVPDGKGTEVRVTDSGSRTPAEADSLREGWADFLMRLDRFAATGESARYEWSQTIGTAALADRPPSRVLPMLRDPAWWREGFAGADVALSVSGTDKVVADFRAPAWAGSTTRAVVTVEEAPGGAYVGVTHDGWSRLPPALMLPERRRFAGLWARVLARLERKERALAMVLVLGVLAALLVPVAGHAAPPAAKAGGQCLAAPAQTRIDDPDRDLSEVEALAKAIKKTTKGGICHALVAFDFEGMREWMTPEARIQRLFPTQETPVVQGALTRGTLVRPGRPECFGGTQDFIADLRQLTSGWMRMDRCFFAPYLIFATKGKERRAVAQLHFWLGGAEATGGRVSDKGEVTAELAEDAEGTWRVARLEFAERERFRASGLAFSEWTERAGLPRDWPDVGYRRELMFGQILYGGIAVGDADNDGWDDLYVSRAGSSLLLRNDGRGGFEDVTEKAGASFKGNAQSALFVDLDNDGDRDLVVVNAWYSILEDPNARREHAIYRNNGDGTFTLARTLGPVGPASGVSAADPDGDGRLDLFVTYYQDEAKNPYHNRIEARDGFGNHLYRNLGDFRFEDVTAKAGVGGSGWSYASAWADSDEDGDIDLFVANDFGDNYLYRNRGDGTFEEVAGTVGALHPANGMSVDWGDYDNDGHFDLYISNMYSKTGNQFLALYQDLDETLKRKLSYSVTGNSMYRNRGDGSFTEVARGLGTAIAGWAWGSNFLDYDNDGWLDLHVANGFWAGDSPEDA